MKVFNKNLRFFKILSIFIILLLLDVFSSSVVFSMQNSTREIAIFIFPKHKDDSKSALLLKGLFRQQIHKLKDAKESHTSFIPNKENIKEIEKINEEGKKLLSAFEGKKAEELYKKGLDLIIQSPGAIPKELIAKICKGAGISLILNGSIEEGKKMIKRSLLLYKNQRASEYAYKIEVKNIFLQVVQDIENEPTGNLTVNSAPEEAEVFVGDEFKGFTPLTITNLPAGEHYVKILLDGHIVFSQFVEVISKGTQTLNAVLLEAPQYEDFLSLLEKIEKKVRAKKQTVEFMSIKDLLGTTDIFFMAVDTLRGKYNLEGFYIDNMRNVKNISFNLAQDAMLIDNIRFFLKNNTGMEIISEKEEPPLETPVLGAMEAISSLTGEEELVIDPDSPIFKVAKKKKEPGIFSKWWFWTIVGVAVGGGTAGLLFLMKGKEAEKGPTGDVVITLHTL